MHVPMIFKKVLPEDFPGGPVVKNSPSNAVDMDSIPGWGTRSHVPHGVPECKNKNFVNTLLLKNTKHYRSLQQVIFFLYQWHQRSLLPDHHNTYNKNEKV